LETDRKLHREFHAEFLHPRTPKVDPRLYVFPPGEDIRVEPASPKWLHRLVYDRAQALAREEHYDFAQWREDRAPEGEGIHALLLIEERRAVGAAGFEYHTWTNYPHGWHLNFIWIATAWRRRGVLSKRWPRWVQTYGRFTVETPLSEAMQAFCAKAAHPPFDLSLKTN
jgi:hypothetical protein